MEKPLITIGIMTYNQEKCIADTLEGVLAQTYSPLELVVLNDASTDGTSEVIGKYMPRLSKKFERVVIIENKENSGNIARNCNLMIREIKGEYYKPCAGDDVLINDAIQLLYEELQQHEDCLSVYGNMIYVPNGFRYGDKINEDNTYYKNRATGIEPKNVFYRLVIEDNLFAAPSQMMRTEAFRKCGVYDESIKVEDYEYWIRLSQKGRILYLNKPVILYRQTEGAMTRFDGENGTKRLCGMIDAVFLTKRKYIQYLSKKEQELCWKIFFERYSWLCKHHSNQEGLNYLQVLMKNMVI